METNKTPLQSEPLTQIVLTKDGTPGLPWRAHTSLGLVAHATTAEGAARTIERLYAERFTRPHQVVPAPGHAHRNHMERE